MVTGLWLSFIDITKNNVLGEHRGSVRISHPAAPVLIVSVPKNFNILNVAKMALRLWKSLIMLIEPSSIGRKKLLLRMTTKVTMTYNRDLNRICMFWAQRLFVAGFVGSIPFDSQTTKWLLSSRTIFYTSFDSNRIGRIFLAKTKLDADSCDSGKRPVLSTRGQVVNF